MGRATHESRSPAGQDTGYSIGNGVSFASYSAEALRQALERAVHLYADHDHWPALVVRAMAYDSRWLASANAYTDLYRRVLRLPATANT